MEKGADANALGRANDKKVTPLHMAESPKIVELLVEYEADTNAIMIHAKKKASVFDSLLRRNPKAAEGLLDCFIGSNDEDLDSPYLQITFDYAFLIDESIECLGREDETFVPNKILDLDDHSLLDHPLISSMLHFCSLFVSDLYFMWIFFYGLCYLLPPKRVKVTTKRDPFPKAHTSKAVAGMQKNLNLLDDQGIQIKQVDCIRIAQLNAHGALTDEKIWYVKEFILVHKPDIILVNEFGQTADVPVYPKIETYKLVTYELKSAFSGVAVYVQASLLQATRILKPKNNMAFSQIAGIEIQGMSIYTVYRSPSELSKLETDLFCEWIESLANRNVMIIGDLNLHVDLGCFGLYSDVSKV